MTKQNIRIIYFITMLLVFGFNGLDKFTIQQIYGENGYRSRFETIYNLPDRLYTFFNFYKYFFRHDIADD